MQNLGILWMVGCYFSIYVETERFGVFGTINYRTVFLEYCICNVLYVECTYCAPSFGRLKLF